MYVLAENEGAECKKIEGGPRKGTLKRERKKITCESFGAKSSTQKSAEKAKREAELVLFPPCPLKISYSVCIVYMYMSVKKKSAKVETRSESRARKNKRERNMCGFPFLCWRYLSFFHHKRLTIPEPRMHTMFTSSL